MIDGLIAWLESQTKREQAVLRMYRSGERTVVEEWELKGQDLADLAARIWTNAEREADVWGRDQKFQLVVIIDRLPRASYTLYLDVVVESKALQLDSSEQSSIAVALLQQSHQHIEVLTRSLVSMSLGNTKAQLAEISRLAHRVEERERRIDAMRDAHERSLDTEFERDLRRKKFDADERRFDEGLSTVRTLFPFVVNSIAKKQLVPTGDNSVLREAMRPVMDSLTPDQVDKLQQVFTPAQMVGLMEVWRLVSASPKGKADESSESNPKTR